MHIITVNSGDQGPESSSIMSFTFQSIQLHLFLRTLLLVSFAFGVAFASAAFAVDENTLSDNSAH